MLTLPPNERKMIGKRLLRTSNENLRRIFFLSYAYRMSGQHKYFKRAEAEMLKAASFSDWNPSHFLDTGEMTMALAIGYDWLYDKLSAKSREMYHEIRSFFPTFVKDKPKYKDISNVVDYLKTKKISL